MFIQIIFLTLVQLFNWLLSNGLLICRILRLTRNLNMMVSYIPVTNVSIRQQHRGFLRGIRNLNMKVSDIHVTSVSVNHQRRVILRDTKYPNIDYNNIS